MEYKVGDVFYFQDGVKGIVINASKNILECQELDINVNGEIRSVYIDMNGNVKEC